MANLSLVSTLMVVVVVVVVLGLSTSVQAEHPFYNGDNETFLELTLDLPMIFNLYEIEHKKDSKGHSVASLGQVLASVPMSANATEVSGSRSHLDNGLVINTLDIVFNEGLNGTGGQLDNISLAFEMHTNLNTSKWELTSLVMAYQGALTTNCTSPSACHFSLTSDVNVAPRNGYTASPADSVCGNGYRICAPMELCWTCQVQNLLPVFDRNDTKAKMAAGIVIPGMRLQPFPRNDTDGPRFGYNWDCDPLLSIGVWTGLLLGLFFAFILFYAASYSTNIYTPTRFDDPKGNKLLIGQTEG